MRQIFLIYTKLHPKLGSCVSQMISWEDMKTAEATASHLSEGWITQRAKSAFTSKSEMLDLHHFQQIRGNKASVSTGLFQTPGLLCLLLGEEKIDFALNKIQDGLYLCGIVFGTHVKDKESLLWIRYNLKGFSGIQMNNSWGCRR